MRFALVILVALAASCGNGDARQVRLELLNRSSCGTSTKLYDTTCIRAVKVQMVGIDGQRYRSQCTRIDAYENLQDLFASTTVQNVLDGVRAREAVFLEFRAYHVLDGGDPCDSDSETSLMLWGVTETIDTTNPKLSEVTLPLECRPDCDCEELGDTVKCPWDLVQGVCAPSSNRYCRKVCSIDDEDETKNTCYDSSMDCTLGACDTIVGPAEATCCNPPARTMCAPCDGDNDCNIGRCVLNEHNVGPLGAERFCADSCPPLPDTLPCPTGMSCHRLGDGTYEPG